MQHYEDAAFVVRLDFQEVVSGAEGAELVQGALQPGAIDGLGHRQPDLGKGRLPVDLERLGRRPGRDAGGDLGQGAATDVQAVTVDRWTPYSFASATTP